MEYAEHIERRWEIKARKHPRATPKDVGNASSLRRMNDMKDAVHHQEKFEILNIRRGRGKSFY